MKQYFIILKIIKLVFSDLFLFPHKGLLYSYIIYFHKLRTRNGLKYAIAYFKNIRLLITRYICGKPIYHNTWYIGTVGGFPKRFLSLKKLIDNATVSELKAIMTLVCFTRAIVPTREEEKQIEINFSTIDAPSKGDGYTIPTWFVKDFCKNFVKKNFRINFKELCYVSTKSSPFGKAVFSTYSAILGVGYNLLNSFINLVEDEDSILASYRFA
jgi:hypothetical protein